MGMFTWADGTTYEGFWRGGQKHGIGLYRPVSKDTRRLTAQSDRPEGVSAGVLRRASLGSPRPAHMSACLGNSTRLVWTLTLGKDPRRLSAQSAGPQGVPAGTASAKH